MKKAAISLMLMLALVLCVVLVPAPKAEAADHTAHCVCGGTLTGKNVGEHSCKTEETWKELTLAVLKACDYKLTSGNYYLSDTLTLEKRIFPVENSIVTICLNGQQLLGADTTADSGRVLNANNNNTELNVCDCKGTGRIASSSTEAGKYSGGIIQIGKESAEVNLFGGTIAGRTVVKYTNSSNKTITPNAGTIYQSVGTLNMYGGTLDGGSAPAAGGSVHIKGTFNMYGGTIKKGNSTASNGGNVAVYGTFLMTGGTIQDGTAGDRGGNIFVNGTAASITGGNVTGGSDKNQAGVHVNPKKILKLGASANIESKIYTADDAVLMMIADWNDEIVLNAEATTIIDLNGYTLSGTITTGSNKLCIADSSATFEAAGTGKLRATGWTYADLAQAVYSPAGRYITLVDPTSGWGYSVHRIYVGFDKIQLYKDDNNKIGMNYVTNFKMDDTLKALLVNGTNGYAVGCNFGVGSLDAAETRGLAKDAYKANISTNIAAILGGETEAATAVAAKICAQTYINLQIGEKVVTITSNTYDYSLQAVIDALYDVENLEAQNADAAGLLKDIKTIYGIVATPKADA